MVTYPELQVLLVSQVQKLAVLFVLHGELVAPLILPGIIRHQNPGHHTSKRCCYDDADFGGNIPGRIRTPERQRPDDIPKACVS